MNFILNRIKEDNQPVSLRRLLQVYATRTSKCNKFKA